MWAVPAGCGLVQVGPPLVVLVANPMLATVAVVAVLSYIVFLSFFLGGGKGGGGGAGDAVYRRCRFSWWKAVNRFGTEPSRLCWPLRSARFTTLVFVGLGSTRTDKGFLCP